MHWLERTAIIVAFLGLTGYSLLLTVSLGSTQKVLVDVNSEQKLSTSRLDVIQPIVEKLTILEIARQGKLSQLRDALVPPNAAADSLSTVLQ